MILLSILIGVSLLLIWQFVGYPLLMAIIAAVVNPRAKDYTYQPFVSILVPTYNEETVITKRLENLLNLNYPKDKYEIIVIDSGSLDRTVNIAQRFLENHENLSPAIKLVQEKERNGKASAINFGKKHASGDLVLVTDANAIFDPDVLLEIMPHFKDPEVGAVGGRYCVANPDDGLATPTSFYWDLEYMMRIGESILDSACLFHGEINAWRKDLADADVQMLSEDLDMCISIKAKGYRIVYEPSAIVYEPAATTLEDQIKQRKRTTIGTIQNLFKHGKFLLSSGGWYGGLIFPSHKTLVMFSPFMLLSIPILYMAIGVLQIVFSHCTLTLALFIGLFAILLHLRAQLLGKQSGDSSFSLSLLLKVAYYVLLNEYLVLLAWKDFLSGRYSVLWEKATTTR
ncbi:MAG: glycosyltransferase [Methanomicrobiales archaeon]|nr:glycosyltransferase [Methanomicrobiales archaeon]